MSIEFKAQHFDILEDALKELGYRTVRGVDYVSFSTRNGTATVRDGRINIDERDRRMIDKIKQQYSREVIKKAASRYGWALKKNSENQFVVNKR